MMLGIEILELGGGPGMCFGKERTHCLGGCGKTNLSVPVVKHCVVFAHEHVAKDPEGTVGLGDVHGHDRQDAQLVISSVDDVLVALQGVVLRVWKTSNAPPPTRTPQPTPQKKNNQSVRYCVTSRYDSLGVHVLCAVIDDQNEMGMIMLRFNSTGWGTIPTPQENFLKKSHELV